MGRAKASGGGSQLEQIDLSLYASPFIFESEWNISLDILTILSYWIRASGGPRIFILGVPT